MTIDEASQRIDTIANIVESEAEDIKDEALANGIRAANAYVHSIAASLEALADEIMAK